MKLATKVISVYYKLIVILVFLIPSLTFAQDPTHFYIGQNDFAGSNIYSLLETSEGRFFAATSTGVYEYKSGKFHEIFGEKKQIGNSLFNLVSDTHGNVYCGNLSGQIFKILNEKLQLFYTVPQKHIGTQFEFKFNKNNDLIYVSKDCLLISKGKLSLILNGKDEYAVLSITEENESFLLTHSFEDNVFHLTGKGEIIQHTLGKNKPPNQLTNSSRRIYYLNKKPISFYTNGSIFNGKNQLETNLKSVPREILVKSNSEEIWGINPHNGIRRIYYAENVLKQDSSIFTSVFTSCITVGQNGTLYLGTFNSGVIVIPNYKIHEHLTPLNEKMTGILATKQGVFLASRKSIYHYGSSFEEITTKSNQTFEKIFSLGKNNPIVVNKKYPEIVFDDAMLQAKHFVSGTLKNFHTLKDSTILFASSTGIFKIGNGLHKFPWKKINSKSWRLDVLGERCNAVYAPEKEKIMLIATHSNLIELYPNGKQRIVKFKSKNIVCIGFASYKGKLFLATYGNGILEWKDGEISQFGLRNEAVITKIEIYNKMLFCSTSSGMHIYNFELKSWREIGISEGLMHGIVNDFSIYNNTLWLLSGGTPVSIRIDEIKSKKPTFKFVFADLYVDDERIKIKNDQRFSHEQNRFLFNINFHGIEYEQDVSIRYRIKGLDSKWITASISDRIEYKAIPPGKYTFELQAMYHSKVYPAFNYNFRIAQPFWFTWWFGLLVILFFVAIVYLFFKLKFSRLEKKKNFQIQIERNKFDLLESEMKALRSQMNPHFIFNSLNSIQDLILREDTDASYDYIVMFAELVRNTLNYSNKDFIPLEKEIEFLNVYLSLEELRFKVDFEYDITSSVSEEISVPSLLVQPFVENALIHGLMHQTGMKKLSIHFSFDEKLVCTIEDNGIGRARAKEIQKRQGKSHESFAMNAIEKRLELINEQNKSLHSGFVIQDLEINEISQGTKVIIQMPFKRKF